MIPPLRQSLAVFLKIFLGTIILLIAVEYLGRFIIHVHESARPSGLFGEFILSHNEPLVGFGLKKGISQYAHGWHVKTNQLGFREDEELGVPKPDNELRIFVVGGSTVFG